LIVEGRTRTKESPFESGAGSSPEAWCAKVHIFRPRSHCRLFDSENDVVHMTGVNESCFPYNAGLLREIVVSIRRIQGRTRCMRLAGKA